MNGSLGKILLKISRTFFHQLGVEWWMYIVKSPRFAPASLYTLSANNNKQKTSEKYIIFVYIRKVEQSLYQLKNTCSVRKKEKKSLF